MDNQLKDSIAITKNWILDTSLLQTECFVLNTLLLWIRYLILHTGNINKTDRTSLVTDGRFNNYTIDTLILQKFIDLIKEQIYNT